MTKAIKLSEKLVKDATIHVAAEHRSTSQQIEYWAFIGKAVEENSDLPFDFIKSILIGTEEAKAGQISGYEFG